MAAAASNGGWWRSRVRPAPKVDKAARSWRRLTADYWRQPAGWWDRQNASPRRSVTASSGRLTPGGRSCWRGLRRELESMVPRVRQVMRQTNARVFAGDTHAENKIVSLFEPSTEVIRKGKAGKPTEFGKIVKLQEAEHQIVVAYEVYDRRPNHSDLL